MTSKIGHPVLYDEPGGHNITKTVVDAVSKIGNPVIYYESGGDNITQPVADAGSTKYVSDKYNNDNYVKIVFRRNAPETVNQDRLREQFLSDMIMRAKSLSDECDTVEITFHL
jgi:hypothetical protein